MAAEVDREQGFIVIHRRVRSSRLYRSLTGEQRSVFLSVLLLANWGDGALWHAGSWHKVGRGELAHSLRTIAEESGVSVKVVRTALAKMMADDTLAGGRGPFLKERWTGTQVGTGLRILTVVNYSEYQGLGRDTGTPLGTVGARSGHDTGTTGAPREPEEPEEPDQPTTKETLSANADRERVQLALVPDEPKSDARTVQSQVVFGHWCRVMGKRSNTEFDKKRRGAVEARLRGGYTVEQLCKAVDGCAKTPHNTGQNDRGQRYDDLELICRDAAHVDRFIHNDDHPPQPPTQKRDYSRGRVGSEECAGQHVEGETHNAF